MRNETTGTANGCKHVWSESTSWSHFWCYKCGAYLHKFTKWINYPSETAAGKGPKEVS